MSSVITARIKGIQQDGSNAGYKRLIKMEPSPNTGMAIQGMKPSYNRILTKEELVTFLNGLCRGIIQGMFGIDIYDGTIDFGKMQLRTVNFEERHIAKIPGAKGDIEGKKVKEGHMFIWFGLGAHMGDMMQRYFDMTSLRTGTDDIAQSYYRDLPDIILQGLSPEDRKNANIDA